MDVDAEVVSRGVESVQAPAMGLLDLEEPHSDTVGTMGAGDAEGLPAEPAATLPVGLQLLTDGVCVAPPRLCGWARMTRCHARVECAITVDEASDDETAAPQALRRDTPTIQGRGQVETLLEADGTGPHATAGPRADLAIVQNPPQWSAEVTAENILDPKTDMFLEQLFAQIDRNNNGSISRAELVKTVRNDVQVRSMCTSLLRSSVQRITPVEIGDSFSEQTEAVVTRSCRCVRCWGSNRRSGMKIGRSWRLYFKAWTPMTRVESL